MTYKKQLEKRVLAGLLAGAALWLGMPAALAASGAVPNTQLPQGGHFIAGGIDANIVDHQNGQMTITQGSQNAVIQWGGGFNVGANATVNFKGPESGYNTLNYDASGNMSQIYGAINANNNGNIYIVNPAGVEISSSAQINVGSLYVANRDLSDTIKDGMSAPTDMAAFVQGGTTTDAALMSLGNINADHVTFDGGRIVIDTERLKTGDAKMKAEDIHVRTTDAGQVVLGYDGYDESSNTYGETKSASELASVKDEKGNAITDLNGYMWVEDIEQLQAVNTNDAALSGQYALRNSIDATATQDWNDQNTATATDVKEGFASIGNDGNPFTGKFDGLDYNIFNLNINRTDETNVGLFGMVGSGAVIQNVTLVGGSIKGRNNVGALAGSVQGSAQISNIMNSASVTGSSSVGGIIGSAASTDQKTLVFKNLVNTGTISGTENNIGGLIGSLSGGTLSGTSYNLGGVTGDGYNVGGLVGTASNAILGDGTNLIYNRLNVSGLYNVGGIVGSMTNTTVQNAENSGNVTATGYTTGDYTYHTAHYDGGTKMEYVYIANAGGIAGKSDSTGEKKSEIKNVQNSGDVSSGTEEEKSYTYYTAGNVGGIAGSAVDTNITNATNEENDIRGAHNVGGIAGYFSGTGTITTGINSGGDILATGARYYNGFVKEWVRTGDTGQEEATIGNMGGIVGYMDGDGVYIVSSANRGTVHSQDITGNTVLPVSEAANVGGIVGKIDRSNTLSKDKLETDYANAAVSNSYNTGDVRGYTAVGGVAGMMYNGEIAGSYNLGTINTTRKYGSDSTAYYTVNMGGIVGDTTENANASALLYDVYNKGQIGDSSFNYASRHVGGIVGRLSGTVEKAYNTGAIYNGYNVVGGIAGWMSQGSITNSFNTGNITVKNQEKTEAGIQAGGIVGGASTGKVEIFNVYNLGTIRGFQSSFALGYAVGGIVGAFIGDGNATVSNAYTTGNLYLDGNGNNILGLGSIYGTNNRYKQTITTKYTYYIKPADGSFTDLSLYYGDNSNKAIEYDKRHDSEEWDFNFSSQEGGKVTIESGEDWRIYDGNSLPILNAFLPNTEDYFDQYESDDALNKAGIASIQYGTAYDPLLTIINAADKTENLTFDWQKLGASNAAGIAVYGAGLTLNDFMVSGGSGYFGGLIYSDGALAINAHTSEGNTEVTGDVALGSASQLYGSSVSISADGNVTIYGNVTATGNTQDGTTRNVGEDGKVTYENLKNFTTSGDISITGGSVDVYGQLTSAKEGEKTKVPGINGMAESWTSGDVGDPTKPMTDIGDRFGYTTGASAVNGNISITAKETASEDGHVNVYYGHQQKGFLDTAGNLTVSGSGDVYMDSDLSIGGNLSISAGADSEAVLDISNIGQVQAANDASQATSAPSAVSYLHKFLDHFSGNSYGITLNGGKQKIAVDMWETNETFNLKKFDLENDTLASHIKSLNITANNQDITNQNIVYIWVSTGEELKNIQTYYQNQVNENQTTGILSYNFALKNDIDASAVTDYVSIGTNSDNGFTGTFDGRNHRIIGLNVTGDNAGIFNTVGEGGKVEDLRVYSGTFSGTDNAGAVAGVNNGTISNVTTFGNVVTAENKAAGGIAGVNAGSIDNASVSDAVTAADGTDGELSTAGGIAGINQKDAVISDSSSDSAVNASAESTYALGGIAGVNNGTLSNVDSLGVTTGIYKGTSTRYSDNVGGIAGRNSGTVSNAYNESIVSGRDNVGGILGINTGKNVENVSNAARVTGEADTSDKSEENKTSDYVGGLVGSNSGSITNGRNNGEITGNQYVGGLVGNNASGSTLSNLVNDEAASITGDNYVGGIAGRNYGTISANDEGLVNRGSITGQMYVGGVAGSNEEGGIIENTISSIALHVKTDADHVAPGGVAPQYFGGVVGQNSGTINGATNESSVDVAADGATMVGGIIGQNTSTGRLEGTIANEGFVSGKSDVGGIIGSNENQNILNNADTDENGQPNKRLVVSNSGRVQAEGGGAAGIFYNNTGDINNADLINTGMVIGGTDSTSITGGLFGTNSGKITNSTLTNNGTVYGGGTVGGLIGKNTGDISTSSLINSVNGKVIGLNNVGGLIGQNYGIITGGRTETDGTDVGYYKYQIYNNGTITVGTWTDSDKDGKIADKEIKTDGVNSSNIGGLVGLNGYDEETKKTGSITAGYNTGAIDAAYSENVGGIAGTNTGKLDQVFNTVIIGVDADGSNVYGSITGSTNVGGIVGSNEVNNTTQTKGTVSNAYNTTGVSGNAENAVVGGIAGTNSGTISNVYTTVSGGLVGKNDSGTIEHNYDVSTSDTDWEKAEIYEGFDFTGTNGNSAVWKIYEGSTNPLLKVFLTKVTYNPENDQNLVYNGKEQTLDVTGNGFSAADGFAAHNNVSGGLIYHDVAGEHKNAGTYTDNLWSEQIKAGSTDGTFNPNNLGYDVQSVKYDIDKAQITINLDTVDRVYGNTTPIEGNGYGFSYGFSNVYENAKDTLSEELKGNLTLDVVKDTALRDETHTNDANGDYTWTGTVSMGNYLDGTSLSQNYEFVYPNGTVQSGTSITTTGDSNVEKATITVDLIDVNRTYGNTDITNNNGKYGVANISGVTNGDSYTADNFTVAVADGADGALDTKTDDNRVTNDANKEGTSYTYTGTVTSSKTDLNNNYNIVVNGSKDNTGTGKSYVHKADLTINLDTVNRTYGDTKLTNNTKYEITKAELVNGDIGLSLSDDAVIDAVNHDEALVDNGTKTNNAGEGYTWTVDNSESSFSGVDNLFQNYNVTIEAGKSTVAKKKLSVGDVTASIIYGNQGGEGFKITSDGKLEGIAYNDDVSLKDSVDVDSIEIVKDSKYDQNKDGRTTANVGTYENSLSYSGLELAGAAAGNYYIDGSASGTIEVTKANLTVDINDVNTTYGTAFNTGDYGYTFGQGEVVNGDDEDSLKNAINAAAGGYINTGMDDNGRTKDVNGDYELKFSKELGNDTLNNYAITVNNGKATIAQKKLTVSDILASIMYGDQNNKGFTVTGGTLDQTGIVYNDNVSLDTSRININDIEGHLVEGADTYKGNRDKRKTADVGTYENSLSYTGLELTGKDAGNYYIDDSVRGTIKVTKASLTVGLGDVHRTYGSTAITTPGGYTVSSIEGLVNGDEKRGYGSNDLTVIETYDKALTGKNTGRVTNNAGEYEWSGTVSGKDGTLTNLSNNYEITVSTGKSYIDKANLTINLNDVKMTYGQKENDEITKQYGYDASEEEGQKLVNGDKLSDVIAGMTYTNTAYNNDGSTKDVTEEGYELEAGDVTGGSMAGNYSITYNAGTVDMDKATITVGLNNVEHTYGSTAINNNGSYGIGEITDAVNGDSFGIGDFEFKLDKDNALTGNTDGRVTENVGTYTYTGTVAGKDAEGKLNRNYDIVLAKDTGKSTVTQANLTIDLNDVKMTYGQKENDEITKQYGYDASEEEGQTLVNGDKLSDVIAGMTYTNTAYNNDGSTKDVTEEGYELEAGDVTGGSMAGNYSITYNAGTVDMDKATITVGLNNVEHTYGSTAINNNGSYGIGEITDAVNGDSFGIGDFEFKLDKDNALTGNTDGRVTENVGTYTYTGTVAGKDAEGKLNRNYDIVLAKDTGKSTVTQANLTINLNDVKMTYGQKENDEITKQYGYDASEEEGQKLVNGDKLSDVIAGMTYTNTAYNNDGSTKDVTEEGYELEAGDVTGGSMAGNYSITYNAGTVDMDKATITVGLNNVEHTYGSTAINNNGSYGIGEITDAVNGDSFGIGDFEFKLDKDNALTGNTDGRVTENVGTYTYTGTVAGKDAEGKLNRNYDIVFAKDTGKSTVSKAEITVSADSHQIYIGAPEPTYTGTTIEDLLVNGDSLNGTSYEYGPQVRPVDTNQSGKTDIGIHFGDTYFGSESGSDWSSAWEGFKNYSITFMPGTLTVKGMPSDMPDISDSEKWNSLLHKAPWSRERNFRERKANIHFIAGGMSY